MSEKAVVTGVRMSRGDRMAQWLTLAAVGLFVVSGAVLALGAHSYGWAALLFLAAACTGASTGVLGGRLRVSPAPKPRMGALRRS